MNALKAPAKMEASAITLMEDTDAPVLKGGQEKTATKVGEKKTIKLHTCMHVKPFLNIPIFCDISIQ